MLEDTYHLVIARIGYIKVVGNLSRGLVRMFADCKLAAVATGQAWAFQRPFFCNLVSCLKLPCKILLISWAHYARKLRLVNFDWIHLDYESHRHLHLVNQFLCLMLQMYRKYLITFILMFFTDFHLILFHFILKILRVVFFNLFCLFALFME